VKPSEARVGVKANKKQADSVNFNRDFSITLLKSRGIGEGL
jgi:hypothetical protein